MMRLATYTKIPVFCVPHYTGKERDAESGNDYFGARYYAISMGRFLSPDPAALTYADITNPQSFNLYSYALNNPLKFIDPTGMYCFYGQVARSKAVPCSSRTLR